MRLRPFFQYFGSKYKLVPYYPKPLNGVIVEPFAGSASYSCAYPDRRVQLYDLNPIICGVWDYLIRASRQDILDLPVAVDGCVLADLKIPQEARWLIGFWEKVRGSSSPANRALAYLNSSVCKVRSFWNVTIKARIIAQQPFIRHWQVRCQSYEKIKSQNATWFVDPPYSKYPAAYGQHRIVDYAHLGGWCRSQKGSVIVCENFGADWLDFRTLNAGDRARKRQKNHGLEYYAEAVWLGGVK